MQTLTIDRFTVDLNRNLVIDGDSCVELEPKIGQVLSLLIERQGEVVSHQELLDHAWAGRVVDPNAVQRCIGQLRKAFDDDAKRQWVIATHPKKGYRLLVQVKQTPNKSDPVDQPEQETKANWFIRSPQNIAASVVCVVALITLISAGIFSNKPEESDPNQDQFTQLNPLTSTETNELYSLFSPDGRYVLFTRRYDGPSNHLVVKDMDNGSEIQLTATLGLYSEPAWSVDGKHIAFVVVDCVDDNCLIPRRDCMSIGTLDVNRALGQPQNPRIVLSCEKGEIITPVWIAPNKIAYIQGGADTQKLLTLDINTASNDVIYENSDREMYALDYSSVSNQLAVTQRSGSNNEQHEIVILSADGQPAKTLSIDHPWYQYRWRPRWNKRGDGFIMAKANHLVHLNLDGKLWEQTLPISENILYPDYHPARNQLVATLGHWDFDLVEGSWGNHGSTFSDIDRSTREELNAQYQPHGDGIAFISDRSGNRQLWYNSGSKVTQLSHFSFEVAVQYYAWAPDGNSIIAQANGQLVQLDLDGNSHIIESDETFNALYQWILPNQLLVSVGPEIDPKLAIYNLQSDTVRELYFGEVVWAQVDAQNKLFVQTANELGENKIHQVVDAELHELVNIEQRAFMPRFFIVEQMLYALGNDKKLWQYNYETNSILSLHNFAGQNVRSLSHVNPNTQSAITNVRKAMNSEIVLLTAGGKPTVKGVE